jgi:hypothetical protein
MRLQLVEIFCGIAHKALFMEVMLTAGLVGTILGQASGARNVGSNGSLASGVYRALARRRLADRFVIEDRTADVFVETWCCFAGSLGCEALVVGCITFVDRDNTLTAGYKVTRGAG